jgi:hypothetical protein
MTLLSGSRILVCGSYKYMRVGLVGGQQILPPFPSECSSFSRDFKTASCSSSYRAAVGTDLDLNVLCFRRTPSSSSFRSLAHSCSEDAPLGLPRISSTPSAWTRIFVSWFNPVPPNSLKRKSPSCFHATRISPRCTPLPCTLLKSAALSALIDG